MNSNDAGNDAPRKRPIIMDRLRHNIRNTLILMSPAHHPNRGACLELAAALYHCLFCW